MAYQLWKFGLLGKDFHYRVFEQNESRPLWSTSSDPRGAAADAPEFGKASWVCNVIDTRQSYLQKLVKQALQVLGYTTQADHSVHYAYEMVALSHATARELGYETDEDGGRPFVEVSGRKGLGVKADDLIDRLTAKASVEVAKRNPGPPAGGSRPDRRGDRCCRRPLLHGQVLTRQGDRIRHRRSAQLRGRERPLSAVCRRPRQQHLQQAQGARRAGRGHCRRGPGDDPAREPGRPATGSDDLWGLVLEAARLDEIVDQAVRTLELSVLAKYAFGLAQAFNGFYHKYPILNEERKDVQIWRAAAVAFYRAQLTTALALMGCTVPARM